MHIIYLSYRYYYIIHKKENRILYGILLSLFAGINSKYFKDSNHKTGVYPKQQA